MTNKTILQLEDGALFLLALTLYIKLGFPILYFFLFLLLPDITILGYRHDPIIGAKLYNLGHTLVLPVALTFISLFTSTSFLLAVSLIWAAHIFMDRAMGYGLKYSDAFKHTHIQNL
ncbi:DUF4260 domain-containing protein [Enterococcus caccae]|uniref:DUF4260 domain-containing protein n=1 Tax=Enterococcus caccae ATCC BAA-1240 TaxID=1158612 RepID=R3WB73_9ENTE|nr:DUF4260 domain-containing protein [Enterococcus caccae]EOL45176.1 hypothetical protein UC7_01982 [Enterococcus caccae ATCC BAA-1240]EOT58583.1 hypothetical protein I580_02754 [Enterococcus caccae ATCC BAA-1240]OJG27088.1 hypothetical protein RU98_GL002868 [Enterococcus caccae]